MKLLSKKKIKFSKILIYFSVVLILFLIFLISYALGLLDFAIKNEKTFRVADECSLVMNNLLHEIKTEDSCRVMCFEECAIRNLNYNDYSFKFNDNACHECICTCI